MRVVSDRETGWLLATDAREPEKPAFQLASTSSCRTLRAAACTMLCAVLSDWMCRRLSPAVRLVNPGFTDRRHEVGALQMLDELARPSVAGGRGGKADGVESH